MAAVFFSLAFTNAAEEQFRAWGSAVSAAFGAAWAKASDTGQIDWDTAATPTAANTSMGYEMWRMADSLQATAPVVVKIEYGSGSTASSPSIWLTIGTGSDGAGNVTGVLCPRTQLSINATASVYNHCGSVGAGRINLSFNINGASTNSFAFALERTHGGDGLDTPNGLFFLSATGSSRVSAYLPFSGSIPPSQNAWNTVVPPSGGGSWSPDVNVYPVRVWTPGESFPLHSVVSHVNTDFTSYSTIPVLGFDGQTRTYMVINTTYALNGTSYGGTGRPAWRYD